MITSRELITALAFGGLLILFALMPSLFQSFSEGVRNALSSLASPPRPVRYERIVTPRLWLAALGAALIAVAVIAA